VPWGSIKAQGGQVDQEALALKVLDAVEAGYRKARKHVVRLASLERYAVDLSHALGIDLPADQEQSSASG
jgi:hypothetical protein